MVPALVRLLEEGIEKVRGADVEVGEGPFFAFMLLIEFEAERACDVIFRAISLEKDSAFHLLGDGIHEFLPLSIPALAHRRIDEVFALACNPQIDKWVRGALARGIGLLEAAGKQSRERIIEMLKCTLQSAMHEGNDVVVTLIAIDCAELRLQELLAEIREANRQGLLDETMISLREVENEIGRPFKPPKVRLEDTIKAVEHWGCFSPTTKASIPAAPQSRPLRLSKPAAEFDEYLAPPTSITIRQDAPHVGRNEPCPCGSGKKFKKCCGRANIRIS